MPDSDLYLNRNTCTLTALPWHFLHQFFSVSFCSQWKSFEDNFNTAFRKNGKCLYLQWKYKPWFELPQDSVPRLHNAQYRNQHYGSERSWDLHMCHWKPRTKHIPDWKINKPQNMSQNINGRVYLLIFICWKFKHIKKNTQIIQVKRSGSCFTQKLFYTSQASVALHHQQHHHHLSVGYELNNN